MIVGRILLVLLVCIAKLYFTDAGSTTCEAVGVDDVAASCQYEDSRPCRTTSDKEIDECWHEEAPTNGYLDNFTATGTVGICPSGKPWLYHGGCVGEANSIHESGVNHRVQDLNISYEGVDLFRYNVTVNWTYLNGDPSPGFVTAYSLLVRGGGIDTCVCINSSLNLTHYSFITEYKSYYTGPLTATVFTFPHINGPDDDHFQTWKVRNDVPSSCADYETELPYNSDTCGLPRYGKPRNIKVQQNGTYTVISWEKPCFERSATCGLLDDGLVYEDPETYFLTYTYKNNEYYLKVTNATEVIVNTSDIRHVQVRAYVPCSGVYEYRLYSIGRGNGCSPPGEVGDDAEIDVDSCCPFVSSSTPPMYTSTPVLVSTPSPGTSAASSFPSKVTIFVSASTTAALLILIIGTITCLLRLQRFRRRTKRRSSGYDFVLDEPNVNIPVLVIYSPRTPEVERKAIQQTLVFDLRDQYGITSYAPELRNEKYSLYDWITEHHEKAHAVFCVCNRYFYEEWNQTADLESNPSVVYLFKSLFEGNINSNKYAVVLTDDADDVYVPPLLKCRQKYMIDDCIGITRFSRDLCRFAA